MIFITYITSLAVRKCLKYLKNSQFNSIELQVKIASPPKNFEDYPYLYGTLTIRFTFCDKVQYG